MIRATILLLIGTVCGAAAVLVVGYGWPAAQLASDRIHDPESRESDPPVGIPITDQPSVQLPAIDSHDDRMEFYRTVSSVDRDHLKSLIFETAALPLSRQRNFSAEVLLSRYAELNPRDALALSRELGFGEQVTASVFAAWAETDAEAALAAFGLEENRTSAKLIGLAMLDSLGGDNVALEKIVGALPPGLNETSFRIEVLAARAASDPGYAMSEAMALPNPAHRKWALEKVASVIAQRDPRAALDLGAGIVDREDRLAFQKTVMREWAQSDPEATLIHLTDAGLSGEEGLTLAGPAFAAIAATNPQRLLAAAEQWSGMFREQAQGYALRYWSEQDPLSALTYVESLPPGQRREHFMSSVATGYGRQDPQAALAWARELKPTPRGIYRAILSGIARDDSELAFDIGMTLESAKHREEAIQGLIVEAVYRTGKGEEIAAKVLAMEEGSLRDRSLQMLGSMWAQRDPSTAVEWLTANADQLSDEFFSSFARRFAENDPMAAAGMTDRVPATARPGWIQQVARGYARVDAEGASNWISQYQGQPGYESAVLAIAQQAAERDPVRAAQLVAGYSNPQHATTLASTVGDSWARQDPVSAARWAEGLEDSHTRTAAVSSVARQWAERDPVAARPWALQLPEGPARDAALTSVVPYLARRGTLDESLFDAFSSDMARQQAVVRSAYGLARSDMAAARRLVDRYVTDPTLRNQAERALAPRSLY